MYTLNRPWDAMPGEQRGPLAWSSPWKLSYQREETETLSWRREKPRNVGAGPTAHLQCLHMLAVAIPGLCPPSSCGLVLDSVASPHPQTLLSQIEKADLRDEGIYTCAATSLAGESKKDVTLKVLGKDCSSMGDWWYPKGLWDQERMFWITAICLTLQRVDNTETKQQQ